MNKNEIYGMWALDTGNDGFDEDALTGTRLEVMDDVMRRHDLSNWPKEWSLTRVACTPHIEHRKQAARGTWPRQGPDVYFAVQVVPQGIEPLKYLNRQAAERRGIAIIYCGEGYSTRTGPKSVIWTLLASR